MFLFHCKYMCTCALILYLNYLICFSLQKFEHQFFKNITTKLYEINSKTLFVDVGLTTIIGVVIGFGNNSQKK